MRIDQLTLMTASAGAVAVVGTLFAITTIRRHDDRPNRLWTASFLAAFLGLLAGPALGRIPAPTEAAVILTGGVTMALGLLWLGIRAFGGLDLPLWIPPAAAVVAVGLSWWSVEQWGGWGFVPFAVSTCVLTLLTAAELHRGPMRANLNSLLLERILLIAAGGSVALAVLAGRDVVSMPAVWATAVAGAGAVWLVLAPALVALRVERYGNWWTFGDTHDRLSLGLHDAERFQEEAEDRLLRSLQSRAPVHLIVSDLPGLVELNTAFGHVAGDAALRHVADVVRRQAPPSAVLGHLGAGRFAVMTSRDPELVVTAIETGMLSVTPPSNLEMRLDPIFASASADESGYHYNALMDLAVGRIGRSSSGRLSGEG